ncbi:expressed unknown protein [Seminavis robusta]|uniref:Uncharacterized protein n=1 Tax=Seminavis robusta TaxID=568900 RepID=A0A9N8EBI0_9STRA|nr:expressed unknown protein [Seminavis robusta]|eukprot:Sro881_g215270.1 n/a (145) ;mRNA; r:33028-33563
MTSRLIYLLQCMGPRAVRTSTAANSWANVSLWNRFLEEREAEEEENLEIIADALVNLHFDSDNGQEAIRPVEGEEAVEARRRFIQEHYRRNRAGGDALRRPNDPVLDRWEIAAVGAIAAQREQRQLNQPNLDVPVGQEYVYRAQ